MIIEHGLDLYDLINGRDAMESWVDAFGEEEPNVAERVRKTIAVFNLVIAEMGVMEERKEKPKLRLVKEEEK